ncbi:hypothetical protein KDJ57_gp31 [Gordonia phage Catfish]|uniref:Uncharacterized protein n=1 Tax=Gordonia phage Catfish TaxID=2301538 RepID=A0A385D1M1_9CAUD|nr:hypothetical protein KDJ57_gp31 [Gordonia phage Catfish]AXQ51914.1 hypothetical protein SEA_CATFISH_78 [Gordonia phage Catfish]
MIECDGRCVTGEDLGMPEYASAGYFDPECSLHGEQA